MENSLLHLGYKKIVVYCPYRGSAGTAAMLVEITHDNAWVTVHMVINFPYKGSSGR